MYSFANSTWTAIPLLETDVYQPALIGIDDVVIIAGGQGWRFGNDYRDEVHIYNTTSGELEIGQLSYARSEMVAAYANGFVFFAGGQGNASDGYGSGFSSVIDIYDMRTKSWTVELMSFDPNWY